MNKFFINRFFLLFICILLLPQISKNISAQTIVIKNNSPQTVVDYTLEIPVDKLGLTISNYMASFNGETVPVEVITDIYGEQNIILPISSINANEQIKITLQQGSADSYPKRTYAELSHKIGGEFVGHKYEGGYSWVKPNYITLPGSFRDHSYYIKYEGPGWESDKVAFRFYLDNRNAIDVFGKKTSGIVLPAVGVDGFDNYHNIADWGMDNLKVGKALGIGSIAVWDGEKAIRVEEKDSTTCLIPADGKIRSQVKTIYYGWNANGTKCNMTSLISIDAGSRTSHMELLVNKKIENIATGIIKSKNAEYLTGNNGDWTYIATFGKQSLNNDMQGLIVFARTKNIKKITEDNLNHLMILEPKNGHVEYYFMPTWELDKEPVKTKEDMLRCIDEVMNRLNNKITYTITK